MSLSTAEILALVAILSGTAVGLALSLRVVSKEVRALSEDLCELQDRLAAMQAKFERCQAELEHCQRQLEKQIAGKPVWFRMLFWSPQIRAS